jgi:hypothetical protein
VVAVKMVRHQVLVLEVLAEEEMELPVLGSNKVCLLEMGQQILVAAAAAVVQMPQTVALAARASSSLDTHFNWRSTWHILQK